MPIIWIVVGVLAVLMVIVGLITFMVLHGILENDKRIKERWKRSGFSKS